MFGTASAVGTAVAAVVNCYTIPLAAYASSSHDNTWPAVGLVIAMLPMYGFPLYLLRAKPRA